MPEKVPFARKSGMGFFDSSDMGHRKEFNCKGKKFKSKTENFLIFASVQGKIDE
jgi:hypothetical protein